MNATANLDIGEKKRRVQRFVFVEVFPSNNEQNFRLNFIIIT